MLSHLIRVKTLWIFKRLEQKREAIQQKTIEKMAQFRRILAISFLEALDDAIMDVLKAFNPVAPSVPSLLEAATRRAETLTKLQGKLFEARRQADEREGEPDPEEERRIDLETDREVEAMTGYGPKEITAMAEKAKGDVVEIAAAAREDVAPATVAAATPVRKKKGRKSATKRASSASPSGLFTVKESAPVIAGDTLTEMRKHQEEVISRHKASGQRVIKPAPPTHMSSSGVGFESQDFFMQSEE